MLLILSIFAPVPSTADTDTGAGCVSGTPDCTRVNPVVIFTFTIGACEEDEGGNTCEDEGGNTCEDDEGKNTEESENTMKRGEEKKYKTILKRKISLPLLSW